MKLVDGLKTYLYGTLNEHMGKSMDQYDKKLEQKTKELQDVRKRVDDLSKITAEISLINQKMREQGEEIWNVRSDVEKNYATHKDIDIAHNEIAKRVMQTDLDTLKIKVHEVDDQGNHMTGQIQRIEHIIKGNEEQIR